MPAKTDRAVRAKTWTLTVRAGPRVERTRFDDLNLALHQFDVRVRELADAAERRPAETSTPFQRYGPADQVVARLELAGPERRLASVHAGVDVRGDGSTEAYLGRIRRTPLERRKGEDDLATLRRVLLDA